MVNPEDIAINAAGTLALVETDNVHPITLVHIGNISTAGQWTFSGSISRASFINDSLLLLTTPTALYVLDTTSGNISLLTSLSSGFTTWEWD